MLRFHKSGAKNAPLKRRYSVRHMRDFEFLEGVVRVGSIRKAAEDMNITASALNRRINRFEDEFGGNPLTHETGSAKVPAKKPKLPRSSESSVSVTNCWPLTDRVIFGPKAVTLRIFGTLPVFMNSDSVQSTSVTHSPSMNLLNR